MCMKKIYLLIFILSAICGFTLKYLHIQQDETRVTHVFSEAYATNPALTQMTELIQLPSSTPKIIAWHRFTKRSKLAALADYTITEIPIKATEANAYEVTNLVLKEVRKRYAKNKNTRFVLHASLSHAEVALLPFLRALPAKNIAQIHLYEDGYGELFKEKNIHLSKTYDDALIKRIKKAIQENTTPWEPAMNYSLHKLYPTTYHFMHADKIKNTVFLQPILRWFKGATIKNVDFNHLKTTLTPQQKNLLYQLTGFDKPYYEKLMKGKNTLVFTMGFYFNNKDRERAEQNFLTALKTGDLKSSLEGKNYTWFYKAHPSLYQLDVSKIMTKKFPDMIEIPPQVPYEILIVADLKPTKTVGFSSSLFYSLKNEDVLFYIARFGDTYLPFLKKYGIVKKEQEINLNNYIKKD